VAKFDWSTHGDLFLTIESSPTGAHDPMQMAVHSSTREIKAELAAAGATPLRLIAAVAHVPVASRDTMERAEARRAMSENPIGAWRKGILD